MVLNKMNVNILQDPCKYIIIIIIIIIMKTYKAQESVKKPLTALKKRKII